MANPNPNPNRDQVIPRVYDVPSVASVCDFIENIWHRARLTPQSVVICLIYVDRLGACTARVRGVVSRL